MQRITLSIDDDLADFFVRYAEERGYRNRSEAMRDILRNLASRKELEDPAPGTLCVGVASYIYDHHERQLAMRLTELQHEHGDLVISQMHAHVNGDDCLETVFLRGPVEASGALPMRSLPNRASGTATSTLFQPRSRNMPVMSTGTFIGMPTERSILTDSRDKNGAEKNGPD